MIRKANKTMIGIFVTGALALLIAALTVFGSGFLFRRADKYVLFFDGSVKGLSVGAPVIFRGVKIGNVDDISLAFDEKDNRVLIMVVIDVELERVEGIPGKIGYPDYHRLRKRGLQAKLEIQNFITGQLMLAFDFYPDKPVKLYGAARNHPELPSLPISPDIFEIMNEIPIKEISSSLAQTASGLNRLVNSEGILEIDTTLREVTAAARSVRLLADYLEQHPEALLKGKN